jgi:EPS-associated MarR family transcriptional regulator
VIEYKIIKEIEANPSHTQRSLARKLGVSLGKMNYVLSGLIDKGIIKAGKLASHPESIRWNYLLTPQGIEEKLQITRRYLKKRLEEFDTLKKEIELLQEEVGAGIRSKPGG